MAILNNPWVPAAAGMISCSRDCFTSCCCQLELAALLSLRQRAPPVVVAVLLARSSWGCAAVGSWQCTQLGHLGAPCTSSARPASAPAPPTTPAAVTAASMDRILGGNCMHDVLGSGPCAKQNGVTIYDTDMVGSAPSDNWSDSQGSSMGLLHLGLCPRDNTAACIRPACWSASV